MSIQLLSKMTAEEARAATEAIKSGLIELRQLLLDVYERDGWKALGYINFVQYAQTEFDYSKSHAYRLIDAATVERNLRFSPIGENRQIPESHLRALSSAPAENQPAAYQRSKDTAPNGKVTASHIAGIAQEYTQPNDEPDKAQAFDDGDDPLWEDWVDEEFKSAVDTLGYKNWDIDSYKEVAFDAVAERAEEERKKARASNYITLEEWNTDRPLTFSTDNGSKFNETNDNIEWAAWSWNPVTGCLHGCDYCYARDIATRFFDQKFVPSFIPERLSAPKNTKNPKLANETDPIRRMALRNVFTCSMADLFGKWVPTEWIEAVLQQVHDNPQWTFFFLTKFPIRMADFDFPPNSWIGTTVDKQWAVERAEKAFRKIRAGGYEGVAWLSCEPMLERLTFSSLDMFDWVVMGGSSKSTQTPAFAPPPEWWIHLWNQAKEHNIPVYMKTNLIQQNGNAVDFDNRVRQYPTKAIEA